MMLFFSGVIFLLHYPEVSATVILALRGVDDFNKEDCAPLRYASILISKGFFCRPQDVGLVVEMHLRVVSFVLWSVLLCLFLSAFDLCQNY